MLRRLYVAALVLGLLGLAPVVYAEVAPDGVGSSLAKLGGTFCELAGCDMKGNLTLTKSGAESPRLRVSRVGTHLDLQATTSGGEITVANVTLTLTSTTLDLLSRKLVNTGASNSGRVVIDDDAEVTGTLYTSNVRPASGGIQVVSSTGDVILDGAGSIDLEVNNSRKIRMTTTAGFPNGTYTWGTGLLPWASVGTEQVTRASGDLTLSTTTSGDVVLSPASGSEILLSGPARMSVQTLTVPDSGDANPGGPLTGDLATETETVITASVLVVTCEDADGCHVLLSDPSAAGELLYIVDGDGGTGNVSVQPSSGFYNAGDPDAGFLQVNSAVTLLSYEHASAGLERAWVDNMGNQ